MFERFDQMVTGNAEPLASPERRYALVAVFEGVRFEPARTWPTAWSDGASELKGRTTMPPQSFRLRPIMRQGTASSIRETWTHYASVEEARAGAKDMYHNDRVLRVMVVVDGSGSFVEWIER